MIGSATKRAVTDMRTLYMKHDGFQLDDECKMSMGCHNSVVSNVRMKLGNKTSQRRAMLPINYVFSSVGQQRSLNRVG